VEGKCHRDAERQPLLASDLAFGRFLQHFLVLAVHDDVEELDHLLFVEVPTRNLCEEHQQISQEHFPTVDTSRGNTAEQQPQQNENLKQGHQDLNYSPLNWLLEEIVSDKQGYFHPGEDFFDRVVNGFVEFQIF